MSAPDSTAIFCIYYIGSAGKKEGNVIYEHAQSAMRFQGWSIFNPTVDSGFWTGLPH